MRFLFMASQGSPEEIERQWYEHVYRGRGDRMRQLTWRALVMGSVLGGVLSLTNFYIGLKAGWGFGVAITSCILSYGIWTSLRANVPRIAHSVHRGGYAHVGDAGMDRRAARRVRIFHVASEFFGWAA